MQEKDRPFGYAADSNDSLKFKCAGIQVLESRNQVMSERWSEYMTLRSLDAMLCHLLRSRIVTTILGVQRNRSNIFVAKLPSCAVSHCTSDKWLLFQLSYFGPHSINEVRTHWTDLGDCKRTRR